MGQRLDRSGHRLSPPPGAKEATEDGTSGGRAGVLSDAVVEGDCASREATHGLSELGQRRTGSESVLSLVIGTLGEKIKKAAAPRGRKAGAAAWDGPHSR